MNKKERKKERKKRMLIHIYWLISIHNDTIVEGVVFDVFRDDEFSFFLLFWFWNRLIYVYDSLYHRWAKQKSETTRRRRRRW